MREKEATRRQGAKRESAKREVGASAQEKHTRGKEESAMKCGARREVGHS